ncbi:hypothetical protein [Hymenobacter jeollabukensis]|uniref:Uncharacterized protein n=1 Tax=Hymenobacter jeollabukensis TaxID=2025313 RepID=A0A5R8WKG1_9BACT|nr:hypothetical protein [Hymenobacter jeollabukensis]TLM89055.1 hypothetical protein FDY95_21025 [Hymenobacter jeollabukensis]
MTEHPNSADQPRPDAEINRANEPGSQSSSGMSNRIDDALVDALERDKKQRGEPLDITEETLKSSVGSPIGRSPEASTGPVQD